MKIFLVTKERGKRGKPNKIHALWVGQIGVITFA